MSQISKIIIVRYGELFLKGNNRNLFIQQLISNIKKLLLNQQLTSVKIKKISDGLILFPSEKEHFDLLKISLSKVFGISNFSFAYQLPTNLTDLCNFVEELEKYYPLKEVSSFKFEVKRNWKGFEKDSFTLQRELGSIVANKHQLKVNLTQPELTLSVNIYREIIYFSGEKFNGAKGLPIGSSGRGLVLLSGGIDSPVAAWKLMSRGIAVDYLHFYNQKTGQEKIHQIVEKLAPYNNYEKKIYLVNTQELLREISHITEDKYRLIILKRMFVRLANLLQQKKQIPWQVIATGDSLGQVASQTIESLLATEIVSDLLVLRPLITFDKEEIINLAKKLEVYSLSLKAYQDCCSLFEPKHPVTKPKISELERVESTIYWPETLEVLLGKVEKIF